MPATEASEGWGFLVASLLGMTILGAQVAFGMTNNSRIRNLAEDSRTRSAGGRRQVAGLAMPGLIGEQGKGDCLFGFGRQSEFVGGGQLEAERLDFALQHSEQSLIVSAAPSDNVVGSSVAR